MTGILCNLKLGLHCPRRILAAPIMRAAFCSDTALYHPQPWTVCCLHIKQSTLICFLISISITPSSLRRRATARRTARPFGSAHNACLFFLRTSFPPKSLHPNLHPGWKQLAIMYLLLWTWTRVITNFVLFGMPRLAHDGPGYVTKSTGRCPSRVDTTDCASTSSD